MDIEEVKEELTKRMVEAHLDYMEDPVDGEHADGYASGCEYAIKLLENLQEKKVAIPQFVADWIEECDKCLIKDPVDVVHYTAEDCSLSAQDDWLDDIDNQKLLLNAVANGYEVKED